MKLILFFCALSVLQANVIGLVEPGEHPNYDVQLPPVLDNLTGVTLEELLKQNPQNSFAFTSQTDSGPRNLIGYFGQPWDMVIWTTPYVAWEPPPVDEILPIVIPPPPCEVTHTCPPPTGCEATHTCPPLSCEVTHTCPPPSCEITHTCPPTEPETPVNVPEPNMLYLLPTALLALYLRRR